MSKVASAKMVRSLLSKNRFTIRDDLKLNPLDNTLYYQFDDGTILIIIPMDNPTGRLYDSENELQTLRDKILADVSGRPVLDPTFNFTAFIGKERQEKINELSVAFGIETSDFDFSLTTAKRIDNKIKEGSLTIVKLAEHLFPYLVLFVGEVLLSRQGGHWYLSQSTPTDASEPFLEIKGKQINFFVDLFEDLTEQPRRYRTTAFIKLYDDAADVYF